VSAVAEGVRNAIGTRRVVTQRSRAVEEFDISNTAIGVGGGCLNHEGGWPKKTRSVGRARDGDLRRHVGRTTNDVNRAAEKVDRTNVKESIGSVLRNGKCNDAGSDVVILDTVVIRHTGAGAHDDFKRVLNGGVDGKRVGFAARERQGRVGGIAIDRIEEARTGHVEVDCGRFAHGRCNNQDADNKPMSETGNGMGFRNPF
jgi:hypothetical protein